MVFAGTHSGNSGGAVDRSANDLAKNDRAKNGAAAHSDHKRNTARISSGEAIFSV
jgi:hypothetical protein